MALDGFAKALIKSKLITQDQVVDADELARQNKISLSEAIIQRGYLTDVEITQALAKHHRMEFIDLNEVEIPESVIELMPETVARENAVIPMAETGTGGLRILMSNPNDVDTIENLRFILNRDVSVALAPKSMIIGAINNSYGQMEGESADSILQEFTDTAIDFTETVEDGDDMNKDDVDESSSAIVRLVQLMVAEAVQVRASDIHVEPFEDRVRIRYRIDGVLHERDTLPRATPFRHPIVL